MGRSRTYSRLGIIVVLSILVTTSHARIGDKTHPADVFIPSPTVPTSPTAIFLYLHCNGYMEANITCYLGDSDRIYIAGNRRFYFIRNRR
jgi:uncharacterized membrane protein